MYSLSTLLGPLKLPRIELATYLSLLSCAALDCSARTCADTGTCVYTDAGTSTKPRHDASATTSSVAQGSTLETTTPSEQHITSGEVSTPPQTSDTATTSDTAATGLTGISGSGASAVANSSSTGQSTVHALPASTQADAGTLEEGAPSAFFTGESDGGSDSIDRPTDDGSSGATATAAPTIQSDASRDSSTSASSDLGSSSSESSTGPTSTGVISIEAGLNIGPVELDCSAAMPISGAQQRSGDGLGGSGNLAWEISSGNGTGQLTTYGAPALIATWSGAGWFRGGVGYEWAGLGDTPERYEALGTITAQFVANKTGTASQYSYIGMHGWSTDPCIEWYIVDDWFNTRPTPGTTMVGEVNIDASIYTIWTRPTTESGGSRCSGVDSWMQYYSVRETSRRCGQISVTDHFDAWKQFGMQLGDLLDAKIAVEVGGGNGRVEFPIANVIATQ